MRKTEEEIRKRRIGRKTNWFKAALYASAISIPVIGGVIGAHKMTDTVTMQSNPSALGIAYIVLGGLTGLAAKGATNIVSRNRQKIDRLSASYDDYDTNKGGAVRGMYRTAYAASAILLPAAVYTALTISDIAAKTETINKAYIAQRQTLFPNKEVFEKIEAVGIDKLIWTSDQYTQGVENTIYAEYYKALNTIFEVRTYEEIVDRVEQHNDILKDMCDDLDLDLALVKGLAVVESQGYHTKDGKVIKSKAKAYGFLQVLKETGELYGENVLKLKGNVKAGTKHLLDNFEYYRKELSNEQYPEQMAFPLALAAYNCGRKTVDDVRRKMRTNNYWVMKDLFLEQTQRYVGKVYAMSFLFGGPQEESLPVKMDPKLFMDPKEFYEINVAENTGEHHIVKKGETLGRLSRMYGTSISDIMAWNGLKNHKILEGAKLKVRDHGKNQ